MSKRPSPTPPVTEAEAEQAAEAQTTPETPAAPATPTAPTLVRRLQASERHTILCDQVEALEAELAPHLQRLERLRLARAEALAEYRQAHAEHQQSLQPAE